MNKIENNLFKLINSNPQTEYNVIITVKFGYSINELKIKDLNVLMDKIITTKLTGTTIKEISKNEAIMSIELDADLSIL